MSGFGRGAPFALYVIAAVALSAAGPARAQTSIDAGKTPPQLFASDCSGCHKSPQGLAKSGPIMLQGFLREHYTASRETALALANYLAAVGDGRAVAKPTRPAKPREAKPGTNPAAAKDSTVKPSPSKSGADTSSDLKPSDTKPADAKPAEAAPAKSD